MNEPGLTMHGLVDFDDLMNFDIDISEAEQEVVNS